MSKKQSSAQQDGGKQPTEQNKGRQHEDSIQSNQKAKANQQDTIIQSNQKAKAKPGNPGAELTLSQDPNPLEEKIIALEGTISELQELLKRVHADFDNYKKHVEKERENIIRMANQDLMLGLVDIQENFRRALDSQCKEEDLKGGVALIQKQLDKLLNDSGLEPMDLLGRQFDPNLHEAVLQVEGESEGEIMQVIQQGYMLNGKVIRTPRVAVARGKDDHEDANIVNKIDENRTEMKENSNEDTKNEKTDEVKEDPNVQDNN